MAYQLLHHPSYPKSCNELCRGICWLSIFRMSGVCMAGFCCTMGLATRSSLSKLPETWIRVAQWRFTRVMARSCIGAVQYLGCTHSPCFARAQWDNIASEFKLPHDFSAQVPKPQQPHTPESWLSADRASSDVSALAAQVALKKLLENSAYLA